MPVTEPGVDRVDKPTAESVIAVARVAVPLTEGVADYGKGRTRRLSVGRQRFSTPKGEDSKLAIPRVMILGVLALGARLVIQVWHAPLCFSRASTTSQYWSRMYASMCSRVDYAGEQNDRKVSG